MVAQLLVMRVIGYASYYPYDSELLLNKNQIGIDGTVRLYLFLLKQAILMHVVLLFVQLHVFYNVF